jgi:hypothetical protein
MGGEIMNIHIRFQFDKENSKVALIEAENERALIDDILSSAEWYQYMDQKGVNQMINMRSVTSISVVEHSKKTPKFTTMR